MKKAIITILSIGALIAGFLIFYRPAQQDTPVNNQTSRQNSQKWETKTDDQASVTVVVTPVDLSDQSSEWKFDVGMNTHSVELDQDMTKTAILVDDQGKEYQPIRWDGPGGGGHHREGVLVFNKIDPLPKSVELKITGIADTARTFNWQLTQ